MSDESDAGSLPPKRRRAKTVRVKPLSRDERAALMEDLGSLEANRPRHRVDCREGMRPCPFVSCKFHLYLDVNPRNGHIKFNFPELEVWELEETCALDVAEREQGITLEEVGQYMNLTRERVRQVEVSGLSKIQESGRFDDLPLEFDFGLGSGGGDLD